MLRPAAALRNLRAMGPAFHQSFVLTSARATTRFAQQLAPRLKPGDTLLLRGELGTGKTHFARALIQERLAQTGRSEDVPSPTYTLVQTYDDGETEIWHCDLYRLSGPDEALELGLEEAFETAICLIEWPERLAGRAPKDALILGFAMRAREGERKITATARDKRWETLLRGETERLTGG